jgi:hypothetical protein
MKKSFSLAISVLFLSILGYSQTAVSSTPIEKNSLQINKTTAEEHKAVKSEKITLENAENKVLGTYLIVNARRKEEYLFSKQSLLEIEKRRDDNNEVLYELSPDFKVRILPRSVINAPGFVPIKNMQE